MIGDPVEGEPTLYSVAFDLRSVGYAVEEYFVEGLATSYREVGSWDAGGRWEVSSSDRAEFRTRIVVYRPADPHASNGTAIVEWLNVTGGLDVPDILLPTQRHLFRDGFTWVGISTQYVGIHGGGIMPGIGLKQMAPDRYGDLCHPGDEYCYDMFTQIGDAVRDLLSRRHALSVDRTIAVGGSQSACYLTTYINALDPHDRVFDAFALQGRGGKGAPIGGWEPLAPLNQPVADNRRARLMGRDRIRLDGRVPVMIVQSETDVLGAMCFLQARQDDNPRLRLWEVAGSAHSDTYFQCAAPLDTGRLPVDELAELIGRVDGSVLPTKYPMNSGPQMHYVLERAIEALDQWIRDGTPPPSAPRLWVDEDMSPIVDDLGVQMGGIRSPWVDAPVSVLSGLGQVGDMAELFGTTSPLTAKRLAARYPGGFEDYGRQFDAATARAVDDGFILPADVAEIEALGRLAWP
jgi:hypothetical protein